MATLLHNPNFSEDVQLYLDELRIKLAYRMSTMFLIVFAILTYAYYFDSVESFLTMAFGFVLSVFCLVIMYYKKNYQLVFILYSVLGVFVTSFALIFFHETIHLVDVLWMLAAVSLAFLGVGRRVGIILLFVSLICIAIFIFYSLNIHIEAVKPRTFYQKIALVTEMISGFSLNFYLFYLFTNVSRYSAQKLKTVNEQLVEQNTKIKQQNEEKTVLVKEVHHRVKNNLQIIISLLRLQSSELQNDETKALFNESIQRIMAMSLIHQKLYQNESLSQVKFVDYANDLIETIIQTDPENRKIKYYITSEINKVGLKSLIPIGLILNELVLNSMKHAFQGKTDCVIEINLNATHQEDFITLIYKDNGTWKEKTSDYKSFGLMLVETLVEQLDGKMEIVKDDFGTTFEMQLHNIVEENNLV
ncbi:MAG TPA: histidine kinase dimerization/phosphoacceptor domain -containing protein [Taishania sp.]|nr:histidine kinase dimerization/phosphoacceptor domain -containing protein [Taishania sp.]